MAKRYDVWGYDAFACEDYLYGGESWVRSYKEGQNSDEEIIFGYGGVLIDFESGLAKKILRYWIVLFFLKK